MASERTHDAENVTAEAVSPAVPVVVTPALATLLGNRALGRLARRATPPAGITARLTSNRALARIIHEDEDTSRPAERFYSPKSSQLRDEILKNAAGLVDASEGSDKFYRGVDSASIAKGREWAAAKGTTYTDCIDFAGRRLGFGLQKVGKQVSQKDFPSPVFPAAHKAFIPAYSGLPPGIRPSPGDIFIMHKPKAGGGDSGDFAHTGVIESVQQGTPEQWTSFDGGQGSASALQHLRKTRDYDPDTNIFGGNWLYGWIDVDLV